MGHVRSQVLTRSFPSDPLQRWSVSPLSCRPGEQGQGGKDPAGRPQGAARLQAGRAVWGACSPGPGAGKTMRTGGQELTGKRAWAAPAPAQRRPTAR